METTDKAALIKLAEKLNLFLVSEEDMHLLTRVKRELFPPDFVQLENYIPQQKIGHAGFQLNIEEQLNFLKTLQGSEFQELFVNLRSNEDINVGFGGKDYKSEKLIHNGYYPTPDAELYASMILSAKPKQIIEVGSGYSTIVARTTIDYLGLDCEIYVIDPQPRTDIENYADYIEYEPVEFSSLVEYKLPEDSLLFIDSSHVCRSRGDLPFLFCEILPNLPDDVLVHVHDIFLPYDYPDNYFERFYTEEYLLHALLAHSTKFKVIFATHFLTREHPEAMQAVFGAEVGQNPLFFGASFWMRTQGKSA